MKEQLERIKSEALAKMEAADALERLNEIRVAYLGKKGELTGVLKSMKDVAPEDRPKVGQMVNEVREMIEQKLEETKDALAKKAREEQMKREVIDVTLAAKKAKAAKVEETEETENDGTEPDKVEETADGATEETAPESAEEQNLDAYVYGEVQDFGDAETNEDKDGDK